MTPVLIPYGRSWTHRARRPAGTLCALALVLWLLGMSGCATMPRDSWPSESSTSTRPSVSALARVSPQSPNAKLPPAQDLPPLDTPTNLPTPSPEAVQKLRALAAQAQRKGADPKPKSQEPALAAPQPAAGETAKESLSAIAPPGQSTPEPVAPAKPDIVVLDAPPPAQPASATPTTMDTPNPEMPPPVPLAGATPKPPAIALETRAASGSPTSISKPKEDSLPLVMVDTQAPTPGTNDQPLSLPPEAMPAPSATTGEAPGDGASSPANPDVKVPAPVRLPDPPAEPRVIPSELPKEPAPTAPIVPPTGSSPMGNIDREAAMAPPSPAPAAKAADEKPILPPLPPGLSDPPALDFDLPIPAIPTGESHVIPLDVEPATGMAAGSREKDPNARPANTASATDPKSIPLEIVIPPPAPTALAPADDAVEPAECASCGRNLAGNEVPYFMGGDGLPRCAEGKCIPGRAECSHLDADTAVGRFFAGLYECLCCPDPCYEPKWIPVANAAFFVDYARPQTLMRLRIDEGIDMIYPDRSEFFWARNDGKGMGPSPPSFTVPARSTTPHVPVPHNPSGRPPGLSGPLGHHVSPRPPGLGPVGGTHTTHASHRMPLSPGVHKLFAQPTLDYHQLNYYTEIASPRAAFFFEIPYRYIEPALGPTHSGFSDMNLGTKSLLLDCELLQLTFQFRTYLPMGNAMQGLGTGHVSLEPSLLSSLRLSPNAYMQGQLSQWIPLGGDPGYAGALLHYHMSLNQVLWRLTPDSPLIGTAEFNGWSFQAGQYTNPLVGPYQQSSGQTYASIGPGLRMVICNKYDFGLGTAFAVTNPHWTSTLYRIEFRVRF